MRTAVNVLAVLLALSIVGNIVFIVAAHRRAERVAAVALERDALEKKSAEAQLSFDLELARSKYRLDSLTAAFDTLPSVPVEKERVIIIDRPRPATAAGKRDRILRAIGR